MRSDAIGVRSSWDTEDTKSVRSAAERSALRTRRNSSAATKRGKRYAQADQHAPLLGGGLAQAGDIGQLHDDR
jgi:hypothetical protein